MPWQEALYLRFLDGDFPDVASLPTGLGKTNVVACWLLALADQPARVPRRLVYVVNRRTVVDQATAVVERMRERLDDAGVTDRLAALCGVTHGTPLALSTLRGQFADNAEWRRDPARPAIIVGTVDMIGSRLLFSGYGAGFRTRPLLAAFLGQDALIVHDEAHLEPAFQVLLESVRAEQVHASDLLPLRVLALTATPRATGDRSEFTLSKRDLADPIVNQRINASKSLHLHIVDEKRSRQTLTDLALQHRESGDAILIFVRTVDAVADIRTHLLDAGIPKDNVTQLTGAMRGHERDLQLDPTRPGADAAFARFLRLPSDTAVAVEPVQGTVYLVSTSAGEVGVDISADHMVTDLTTFDAMAQRLGRVNRYGTGSARVDVVVSSPRENGEEDGPERRTIALLRSLDGDASPAALQRLEAAERVAAYAPSPALLPATDILFDAWSLTTLRKALPGRPEVADYLHGLSADIEGARTYVAWRHEVDLLDEETLARHAPADLLSVYPLKPHEYLSDLTYRVLQQISLLAKRRPDRPVWIHHPSDRVKVVTLAEAARMRVPELANRFVILGPSAGGLRAGMLDPVAEPHDDQSEDVADYWGGVSDTPLRVRRFSDEPQPAGMRLVRTIVLPDSGDEEEPPRSWLWYVRRGVADEVSSTSASAPQMWQEHTEAVRALAHGIALRRLPERLVRAVELAALAHDLGKRRELWQRAIGNREYPAVALAKRPEGAETMRHNYRHELGSLADLNAGGALPEDSDAPVRELVLHLVAAHHGRGRPCFRAQEQIDPESPADAISSICASVPERFGRLQIEYGRWGLAYLESLLRAADYIASEDT